MSNSFEVNLIKYNMPNYKQRINLKQLYTKIVVSVPRLVKIKNKKAFY